VSTDNAQIDGDKIAVNAPASGTLIDWRATQGAELHANQVVGRIKVNGGFVQPQQSIKSPGDATVAVDNGVEGAFVTAGTQLAVGYDFSKVYVTARVDETDVDAVRPGQRVEFTVDAFPDTDFTGVVREIQGGAAGVFSLFPQSNSSGNFQKVTQVIPVKIAIDDLHGLNLVPGMNVVVKIRKDG
jgi:multidrug resistance efflux pump